MFLYIYLLTPSSLSKCRFPSASSLCSCPGPAWWLMTRLLWWMLNRENAEQGFNLRGWTEAWWWYLYFTCSSLLFYNTLFAFHSSGLTMKFSSSILLVLQQKVVSVILNFSIDAMARQLPFRMKRHEGVRGLYKREMRLLHAAQKNHRRRSNYES